MKKIQLILVGLALLGNLQLYAQKADTLAFWDFEGAMVDGIVDPYAYYVDDEVQGTAKAWVKPNVGNSDNLINAKFSAYREGFDASNAPVSFYQGLSRTATTIFGLNGTAAVEWRKKTLTTVRYWYMENVSTVGFNQVNVSIYLTCAGTTGPGKFRFGYKIGEGEWIDDAEFKDVRGGVTTSGNFVGSDTRDLWSHNLPASCANQSKISVRWCSNDLRADNVQDISSTGYSRVDNISATGVKIADNISNAHLEMGLSVDGNRIVASSNVDLILYNLQGVCLKKKHLCEGETEHLNKGCYIIKTSKGFIKAIVL